MWLSQLTSLSPSFLRTFLTPRIWFSVRLFTAAWNWRTLEQQAQFKAFALGYFCEKTQPRICVGTHHTFDQVYNAETVVDVRAHWEEPFAFGAQDNVVFNIREDSIWHCDPVIPELTQAPRPQLPPNYTVPVPRHKIEDVPPAEFEKAYYEQLDGQAKAA